ncbi:MAG: hypothetical protein OES13_06585 [Acidimicrobiia bacterium]|nr:hypothetical protein [Acidimicrobiia bacterium]
MAAHAKEPNRIAQAAASLGAPRVAGWFAAGVEAALVILLLGSPMVGGAAVAIYIAALMLVITLALRYGATIEDCACGSKVKGIDQTWYVRNTVLVGAGIFVVLSAPTGQPWIAGPLALVAGIITTLTLARRSRADEFHRHES